MSSGVRKKPFHETADPCVTVNRNKNVIAFIVMISSRSLFPMVVILALVIALKQKGHP
jgi:hypothetical protein